MNRALINRHRVEKFASPGGSVQIMCRWSGSTTAATMSNACVARHAATLVRNSALADADAKTGTRRPVTTVKKYVAPATPARR